MRKKLHKRIDPKNKEYDRFYVVNYLVSVDLNLCLSCEISYITIVVISIDESFYK